ncbi:MAG: TIGR00266 family protein [Methanobrevibacter sp.]|nr:TIGR00266 family protein [Methanobrevibacter sp.]
MKYEIKGGAFPVVICELEQGERIVTEGGGMAFMTPQIKMETSTGGGLMKGLARTFSGESLFLNYYTAEGPNQSIGFASSFPGTIMPIRISGNSSIIAQKTAFLAAEDGVEISTHFRKNLASGFFGGEGFILQKFTGEGIVFLEIDGDTIEYNLKAGERMVIDQGHLAAMDQSVEFDIQRVKGVKNMLFGGEGMFLANVTGPGRVWLQTMPLSNFINIILPYVNTGK